MSRVAHLCYHNLCCTGKSTSLITAQPSGKPIKMGIVRSGKGMHISAPPFPPYLNTTNTTYPRGTLRMISVKAVGAKE